MRLSVVLIGMGVAACLLAGCAKPHTFDEAQGAIAGLESELVELRAYADSLEVGDPRRDQLLEIEAGYNERVRTIADAIDLVSGYNIFPREARSLDLYIFGIAIGMRADIQSELLSHTPGWAHPELDRSPFDRAVDDIVEQAGAIADRAREDRRVPRG